MSKSSENWQNHGKKAKDDAKDMQTYICVELNVLIDSQGALTGSWLLKRCRDRSLTAATNYISLKGTWHDGNEADFLGFLQKLVPHRSLTLPFEPFRFWLRIRGDIRNRKTGGDSPTHRVGESLTLQLGESGSWRLPDSLSRRVGFWMFKRKFGKSGNQRLPDSANRGVVDSPTQRVGELLWSCYSNFLKFIIKLQHFKRLNQHLKGPI
jgi:hypothetical protein